METARLLYFRFKPVSMSLSNPVLALMLLASCNPSENDHHLMMLAISEVSYDKIRDAILRIFGLIVASEDDSTVVARPEVKVEPVILEDNTAREVLYTMGHGRFGSWGNGWGRHRPGASYSSVDSRGRKLNPLGSYGQVSKCVVCKSILHWVKDCPHDSEGSESKAVKDTKSKVNFSMFVGCTNSELKDKLSTLVSEFDCCTVLDSGCSRTVCGELWLRSYISNLSDFECSLIREQPSNQVFTLGYICIPNSNI